MQFVRELGELDERILIDPQPFIRALDLPVEIFEAHAQAAAPRRALPHSLGEQADQLTLRGFKFLLIIPQLPLEELHGLGIAVRLPVDPGLDKCSCKTGHHVSGAHGIGVHVRNGKRIGSFPTGLDIPPYVLHQVVHAHAGCHSFAQSYAPNHLLNCFATVDDVHERLEAVGRSKLHGHLVADERVQGFIGLDPDCRAGLVLLREHFCTEDTECCHDDGGDDEVFHPASDERGEIIGAEL